MRVVVDLPDDQADMLGRLAAEAGRSRDVLIREALQNLIASRRPGRGLDEFFGLWRPSGKEDGLAYQERMRAEWPE